MADNGWNRREAFKIGGAGAGLGLLGGPMIGAPSRVSAGMIEGIQLVRSINQGRELDPNAGLSVVLLGTGTPIPSLDRACASTMVIAGDRTIMVDSGRFSSIRMAQAGVLSPDLLLYTHFHSDHITDFGEVMINRFALFGADKPLPVIGPVGVKDMIDSLMSAYAPDKQYRIDHHGWAVNEAGYEVDIRESKPGVVYDEGGLRITMFEVDHRPVVPAMAYRFDYKGQSVVVSGDTKKVPQMAEMSEGCDILVHEAMNEDLLATGRGAANTNERTKKMSTDILDYHTMTDEVAEIARDAGVKKLVLTHMVPSPMNRAMEAMFIRGMRKIYKGPIKVGRDLMEVKVWSIF
jgi:ribonuclease Z